MGVIVPARLVARGKYPLGYSRAVVLQQQGMISDRCPDRTDVRFRCLMSGHSFSFAVDPSQTGPAQSRILL